MKIKLQDRTTGVTHTGRQRCCHFLNNTVRPHSIKEVSSEKTEMEITFLEIKNKANKHIDEVYSLKSELKINTLRFLGGIY